MPDEPAPPVLVTCYRCGELVSPKDIDEDTTTCVKCSEEAYFDE